MRQIVKIVATLGMLIFLFPVYSMELEQEQGQRDGSFYHIFASFLKNKEPFKPIRNFQYSDSLNFVDFDDLVCSDRGLALIFSATRFIMVSDKSTEKKILKTIKDAVREGEKISIYSSYAVSTKYDLSGIHPDKFIIFPENKPISIF